jgi:hypothetical protein
MRLLGLTIVFLISAAKLLASGLEDGVDLSALLPRIAEGEDWTWGEEPSFHNPENLFEYLNGAAPQYLSYGFVKLLHARYLYMSRDLESVTIDIYDMGSRLGAYGIYSSGRPRGICEWNWGVEGYRSGTVAAAWKGRVYVHASADEETPVLMEKLESLLKAVTEGIPGDSSWPPEISLLPKGRLITGSDRYLAKNLLGHSFLPGGFLANYEGNGKEGLLFLSKLETPGLAKKAFALLYTFEAERGKLLIHEEIGEKSFWVEDPGLGYGVVIRRGSYLGGLWGIEDLPIATGIIRELDRRLLSSE